MYQWLVASTLGPSNAGAKGTPPKVFFHVLDVSIIKYNVFRCVLGNKAFDFMVLRAGFSRVDLDK